MSLKKNILASYLSQIVNVVISFAISILTARILGASGRGDLALFNNSLNLASAWLGFSVNTAIVYFVASGKMDPAKIFYSLGSFSILATLLVFLLLKLVFLFRVQSFVFPAEHGNTAWMLIFCLQFFITLFNTIVTAFLSARQKFVHIGVMVIFFSFLSLVIYLLFLFKKIHIAADGFTLIVITTLLVAAFQILVNLYFYVKHIPDGLRFSFLSMSELRQVVSYSLIAWLCNAVQFLSYRMDVWFVDYYHGKAETGIYSLAVTLSQLVWILPNSISSVLYAYVSQGNIEVSVRQTYRLSVLAFAASLVAGICAYIGFAILIPIAYGNDFRGSVPMIGILLASIIPFSVPILIASFFAGEKKIMKNLYATLFSFVFCLVGYVLLIKPYGGIGASVATSIGYLSGTVFQIVAFLPYIKKYKAYQVSFKEIFKIKANS